MANSATARWHGENYQARVFWENALNLLDDYSCVNEVTFEADGPKAFDDVVVHYKPPVPYSGSKRVDAEYHQVKWHVDVGGRFGYEDFVCPGFIGAQSVSLLQRLRDARARLSNSKVVQFAFLTTYRVRDGDPLGKLISGNDRTLILERLFDGTTDRSKMGKVRHLWRTHLELSDDDELESMLEGFRIFEGYRTLDELKCQINLKAKAVGIKGINAGNSDFRYDELARQLKARNQNTLTKETLIQLCREEGLLVENFVKTNPILPVAIRTFLGPAADVSDAMPENTLLLADQFKQRYLQDGQEWQRDIRPQVEDFLRGIVSKSPRLRLILDAHASIAFLSGAVLNVKSAVEVHLVQKGRVGARVWRADDGTGDGRQKFSVKQRRLAFGRDIVAAISVAQPVETQVQQYVTRCLPNSGQVLSFSFSDGTGHQAVEGGAHASVLAEQVANAVRQAKQEDINAMVHIFAAVPNSLMFYLGQNHQSIAPCIVYEFDFDRQGNKTYQPSFVID